MLKLENFSKSYSGQTYAVDQLSFEVPSGEITGFIGHNGAGKTTTLRCIVGISDFQHGRITLDGQELKQNPTAFKKQLAFLPDNPDLYEFMTGIGYLNFIADLYEMDHTRQSIIEEYAQKFEITSVLYNNISTYSHGMKQKLALISAFMHRPRVLILDEPFVGLDPQAVYVMKQLLRSQCEHGGSVLFSTHVLAVAEKLCDRLVIIRSGKLVAQGKTETLLGSRDLEDLFLELTQKEEACHA